MNHNHVIQLLESDFVADKVIQELNLIQQLPESGLLAGQAVASVLTDLFGIFNLNPVINDIDIFYLFKNDFSMEQQTERFFSKREELMENNLLKLYDTDVSSFGYGRKVLSTGLYKYSIAGTTRFKKINKVFLQNKMDWSSRITRESFIKSVIFSFDINSTQVGIDLQRRKLYYSRAFVTFLISRQLEIVNWNTPAHSLIRIFKKQKELNAFCNEEEIKMVGSVLLRGYKNISDTINFFDGMIQIGGEDSSQKDLINHEYRGIIMDSWVKNNERVMGRIPLFFGKKYKEDFSLYGKSLGQNFSLVQRATPGRASSESDYETFLAKNSNDYELFSLLGKESTKDQVSFLRELENSNFIKYSDESDKPYGRYYIEHIEKMFDDFIGFESSLWETRSPYVEDSFSLIHALPKILHSYKNVRKNIVYFFNDVCHFENKTRDNFSERDIKTFKTSGRILVEHMMDFSFIGIDELNNMDLNVFRGLHKKRCKHGELNTLIQNSTISEKYQMAKELEKLEEKFGEIFYPVLERNVVDPNDLTVENLSPFVEKIIQQKSKQLKERLVDSTIEEGEIRELISGLELFKEGSEMGHCVGGYSFQVENGTSLIFASKDKNGKRGTLEIRPFEDKEKGTEYRINQYYGKFNARLIYEEVEPFLKEVDKVYKILPLSDKEKIYLFGDGTIRPYHQIFPNDEDIPF